MATTPPGPGRTPEKTLIEAFILVSLVVFLNSSLSEPASGDHSGGELRLYPDQTEGDPDPVVVVPQRGTLVAFDASMLHEVCPVREGTRDVIVDWWC